MAPRAHPAHPGGIAAGDHRLQREVSEVTNEQLGVLLFHFGREINQATSQAETALRARGATLEEGMAEVLELRALANVLISQAQMLGILTPRAPTT